MRSVAPQFATQSARLDKALGALKDTLDGLGAPWGDDKQGKQFGHAYTPQRDTIIKAVGILVEGLGSIHDGLSAHADNHTDADRHNANAFKR
jgi:uncharacterized protein YukE